MSRHGVTLEEAWADLHQGIVQVFERPSSDEKPEEYTEKRVSLTRQRYMLLYTAVHNFCTQTGRSHGDPTRNQTGASLVGSELYNKVIEFLKGHCKMLLEEGMPKVGDEVLQFFSDSWALYTFSAKVLNNLFAYLNRHWVPRAREEGQKDVYEVYKLTLVIWREHLFIPLRTQIFEGVMGLIERERNGEKVNTQLIRNITDCFVDLGLDDEEDSDSGANGRLAVYKKHFEEGFLERTEQYYVKESAAFLQENPVTEYMKKAMQRLEQESTRVVSYLHESTRDALMKKCELTLIKTHEDRLQGEFQVLLNNEKTEDLSRMYSLMARISDGLTPLRDLLEKHVCNQGNIAIEKVEDVINDAKAYVTCLLSVHKRYGDMVEKSFENDASFVQALDRACKKFVNKNAVTKQAKSTAKSPELLAKYCDSLLKKGNKNAADGGEVEKLLDGVMVVFKYLDDNDVFQKFYSKMLAKRLVNSNSSSDDAESSMISKLKQACGFDWTAKFQQMFQDVSISKDLMKKFEEKTTSKLPIQGLDIMVLKACSWPFTQQPDALVLPAPLETCKDKYQMFYLNTHSGRILKWLFHLSKGELRTTYTLDPKTKKPCQYTLQASTNQMTILMRYNDADSYTLEELSADTGIPKENLKGMMDVLCKTKLIVAEDGNYKLNKGFKNKKLRVNINMPMKAESKAESEDLHKTIDDDRKMLVQACIVKIMKTRIRMNHNSLITECITQLKERFKPKVPMLKKQIDVLMEKGYMERVENVKDEYQYLA